MNHEPLYKNRSEIADWLHFRPTSDVLQIDHLISKTFLDGFAVKCIQILFCREVILWAKSLISSPMRHGIYKLTKNVTQLVFCIISILGSRSNSMMFIENYVKNGLVTLFTSNFENIRQYIEIITKIR